MHMKPTTSSLDVFPTPLFRDVVKTVDPNILAIVIAVSPKGLFLILLNYSKKTGLDLSFLSNLRLISKLPFLSKVLEKLVFLPFLFSFKDANIHILDREDGRRAELMTPTV